MIPLPHDITIRDVRQWLSNGYFYVLFPEDSTSKVCKLAHTYHDRAVGENSNRIASNVSVYVIFDENGVDVSGDEEVLTVPADTIRCHWPKCGSINVPRGDFKVAIHTVRPPHRGWARTYDPRRVNTQMPGRWYLRSGPRSHLPSYPRERRLTHALFFPTYPDNIHDAIDKWIGEDGWKSVALNDHTIIVASPLDGQHRVYHNGAPFGRLDSNREVVPFTEDTTNKYTKDRIDKGLNAANNV